MPGTVEAAIHVSSDTPIRTRDLPIYGDEAFRLTTLDIGGITLFIGGSLEGDAGVLAVCDLLTAALSGLRDAAAKRLLDATLADLTCICEVPGYIGQTCPVHFPVAS